jgi:transcriptional regulator with XRE-family HTH domain
MNIRIGEKVKELRKARGLTQSELATMIGVTTSAVSSYEIMERQPSYDILIKIAAYFNVSADYLLGMTEKDMIDVTNLTAKQRNILRETIAEFLHSSK